VIQFYSNIVTNLHHLTLQVCRVPQQHRECIVTTNYCNITSLYVLVDRVIPGQSCLHRLGTHSINDVSNAWKLMQHHNTAQHIYQRRKVFCLATGPSSVKRSLWCDSPMSQAQWWDSDPVADHSTQPLWSLCRRSLQHDHIHAHTHTHISNQSRISVWETHWS